MNIHEYQAKKILKDNGAPVSNGFVISEISEIENKLIQLKGKKFHGNRFIDDALKNKANKIITAAINIGNLIVSILPSLWLPTKCIS